MTINERIKYLRKDVLKMNQTDFAEAIGMKQRGASYIEQSGAGVTDKTIKTICLVFNLNEDWLRNGTEPMYIQEPTFSLDDFVRQHGGTELEIDIMKAYFELEPDTRAMLIQHFKERLTAFRDEPSEMTVEEAEAAYIKSRSKIAQKAGSSALNTTAGTEPGTASENGNNLASNQ
ncbi:MAG: helix-turn-helix domain-containing protein [Lachnospiraceae bacterium]|nr:helix-turn-helix domain-containing protein [Lachnospiraceae bacterium]